MSLYHTTTPILNSRPLHEAYDPPCREQPQRLSDEQLAEHMQRIPSFLGWDRIGMPPRRTRTPSTKEHTYDPNFLRMG